MAASLALAVDLGGTKVEAALVDSNGRLLDGSRFRAPTGPDRSATELADSVETVIRGALAARPDGAELLGVGIGSAGPIRQASGLVSPLNLPAWRDYPLRDLAAGVVPDVPVALRIDGLCIVLAEHWLGAARGRNNVMGMVVSTGVGGGLILGGATVSGPTGNAGHIGHVEVAGFDEPCACGGRGCLEAIASGPSSVAWARAQGWTGTSGEELARSYRAGDPIARRAVERSGRAIGQAIASATALVDLELVAIGGGFSHVTPELFGHIRAAIAERAEFGFVTKVEVVPSELSGDGPLIGAAALVHRAEVVV
ncbi:MAG TPA: ROK family protein [Terrimesophilobacter sp.]|uniref:ROK family protein n=1 Tax=Terrimesophilobacter sp. TaxID=2906435 RepID=UPI002F94EDAF